jgi:hypothetical protein
MSMPTLLLVAVIAAGCSTRSTITYLPDDGLMEDRAITATESGEFLVTPSDQGSVLRVRVGDAITARLPLTEPTGPQWVVARVPDPLVLAVGDVFTWAPSEPGSGPAYTEFVFWVLGPGAATVVLNLEPGGTAATAVTFEFEAASA